MPMIEHDNINFHAVEQQLLQKGSFSPLHWLLDSGLLPYAAYENWRDGQVDSLEKVIACEQEPLLKLLMQGQQHAKALKLVNEPQAFYCWQPEAANRLLPLSDHDGLRQLLMQRWTRSQDIPQLDLFMDSGAAAAQNEILTHLTGRADWAAAEAAYDMLCEVAPNNPHLGGYETLIAYARHLGINPVIDADSLNDELAGLEQEIAPLARELLRGAARDYLAPAWQRLAQSLPTHSFDSQGSIPHASVAWARIPDWQKVIDSIEATADFQCQVDLLQRLAEAYYYNQHQEAALLIVASLIELAPDQASSIISAQPAARLRRHWQDFLDSDEANDTSHFPGWLLLMEPGLLHHLDNKPAPTGASFKAMQLLLQARRSGDDEVSARRALKAVSPELLQAYLRQR